VGHGAGSQLGEFRGKGDAGDAAADNCDVNGGQAGWFGC
jgi:hypothetical protein